MIAFDSCVLIYVLENNPDFAPKAQQAFLDIERVGGVCSSLVITESLYGNIQDFGQLLPLQSGSIHIVPMDTVVAERAGQLRLRFGLKNADAIHLATALEAGAETFITNDKRLLNLNLGIAVKLL